MGRIKGSKMTEEAKKAMSEKRKANKEGRESAFVVVWENIKYLSYSEIDTLRNELDRLIILKIQDEKEKLMKERAQIEGKLNQLNKLKGQAG